MQYLNITLVALAGYFAGAVMANTGNAARDINLDAHSGLGDFLKARQDYEAFIVQKYSLSPRAEKVAAEHAVTVTVTGVPDYCVSAPAPVTKVTDTAPTSVDYYPPATVTSIPTKVEIPFVPGTGSPAPPVQTTSPNAPGTAVSIVPTAFVGTNTTVSTSSLSATKSTLLSKVPVTSSTATPTGGAAKNTITTGLWLTILLTLFGNAASML